MALNELQLLHAYRLLHQVFPEDLHIARPLIQMLQQHGDLQEAGELALSMARRMLAQGRPSQSIAFLALCRQLGPANQDEIAALEHMARINIGGSDGELHDEAIFELIGQLSDLEARNFISKAAIKPVTAGNDIVKQGEYSTTFYLILGGNVEIRLNKGDGYTVMNRLHAGDFFGEFACIYQLRRSATVSATSDCMLLEFSGQAVSELMENYPMAGDYLIHTVQMRMVHAMTYAIPAFSELPEEDRRWMAEESQVSEYLKGEQILPHAGSCNILLTGKARRQQDLLDSGAFFTTRNEQEPVTAEERALVCRVPNHIFHTFKNLYGSFEQQIRHIC